MRPDRAARVGEHQLAARPVEQFRRRCDSSSEILRLTVGSGVFNRRAVADRLPSSTTARKVDIASRRSIELLFHNLEG
jgi:hypothetical protein